MRPTLFIAIAAALITCAGCRNDEIAADVQVKRDAKKAAAASNYLATIDADIAKAEKRKKDSINRFKRAQSSFEKGGGESSGMDEAVKEIGQAERDIEELKRKRLEFEAR